MQSAFHIFEMQHGIPGVNVSEFSEAILAAAQEDWEDRQDAGTGRTYYLNTLTGVSSRLVIGVEYVPTFLELSGIKAERRVAEAPRRRWAESVRTVGHAFAAFES